jgi:DNA polymerase I-like protein with 3'-5' exonuclease and polymerase domains/uracil-DNA glycosylase
LEHRVGPPVGPELNPGAQVLLVGEAPGAREVEELKPFAGPAGNELMITIGVHGVRRAQVALTNALLCRPPDNELDLLLHRFEKENKGRMKAGLQRHPDPFECCKPRLDAEIASYPNVIALGRHAASAVLSRRQGIMDIRGGPITLESGCKVMPTLHPSFVMRARRWTKAFRTDVGRAFRWFRGEAAWRQPRMVINPSAAQLEQFLAPERPYAYDTETRPPVWAPNRFDLMKDPLTARLGLLGIGTDDEVHVVSFLGVDGKSTFYTRAETEQIIQIIKQWGAHPRKLKIDFNGYYDVPVMKWNLGVEINPRLDVILLHRDVEPELPHGLGYVASTVTEIPYAWKIDHKGITAQTDDEWRVYNGIDVVLTHRCATPLWESVHLRNQQVPVQMHHAVQRLCIGMHENGIFVNRTKQAEWDVKLRAEASELLADLKMVLGVLVSSEYAAGFNPGSVQQLKDLFFARWGFIPAAYSDKTGEPSTGDEAIREWLRDPKLLPIQSEWLKGLRHFRAVTKLRGTYVRKLVPWNQMIPSDPLAADFEDDAPVDDGLLKVSAKPRAQRKDDAYGLILGDSRVHPHFNSHSVATGWRTSSSNPNSQNFPRKLRSMIAPWGHWIGDGVEWKVGGAAGQPRHVFLYADQDQGEMRIIAALSRHKRLLQAFKDGKDPHAMNAEDFFGLEFNKTTGKDWERLRDFSKCVVGDTRIAVPGKGLLHIASLDPHPDTAKAGRYSTVSIPTIGRDGKAHEATKFYYAGKQKTIKVVTRTGYVVEGTAQHRVLLASGKWVRLHAVKPGDALRLATTTGCFAKECVEVPVNPWVMKQTPTSRTVFDQFAPGLPTVKIDADWGYLLGALQGDGCVRRGVKGQPLYVSLIGLRRDGVVERVTRLFEHFGLFPYVKETFRRGGRGKERPALDDVHVGSKAFAAFLLRIGFIKDGLARKVAAHKYVQDPLKAAKVTELIFRSPKPVVAAYLAGLFDTDGTVSSGGWSVTAKSEELLRGVKLLLDLFGIRSKILKSWNVQYGRFYYTLGLNRTYSLLFYKEIAGGMACRRKVDSFLLLSRTWAASSARRDARNDACLVRGFDYVQDVRRVRQRKLVYDLVVPKTHSFAANGLINHNTAFYAIAYKTSYETYYETLTSAEDAAGNLPFVHFPSSKVRATYDRWYARNQEIVQWWDDEIETFRRQGFLADPLFGYRCDFLDGEQAEGGLENKLVNFRSQSLLGAVVKKAAVQLCDGPGAPIPFGLYGHGTGLILDGHDRLDFELPVFHARRWAEKDKKGQPDLAYGWCKPGCLCPLEKHRQQLTEAMHQTVPGLDVEFTGKAKVVVNAWV